MKSGSNKHNEAGLKIDYAYKKGMKNNVWCVFVFVSGESMEATMKFSCESIPAAYDANGNATNLQSHV